MADDATPTPADVPAVPVNNGSPASVSVEPTPPPSQIPPAADPNLNSDTQKGVPPSSIPNTVDQSLESHVQADDGRNPSTLNK